MSARPYGRLTIKGDLTELRAVAEARGVTLSRVVQWAWRRARAAIRAMAKPDAAGRPFRPRRRSR